MRELNLDRLRTLVTIADLGSFAEAARTLHLAPPTVSLHIADLEALIGAPLLVRKRGEVRPSGAGEVLVERARRLLADADEAMDLVRRQVQGLEGRVRLGASTRASACCRCSPGRGAPWTSPIARARWSAPPSMCWMCCGSRSRCDAKRNRQCAAQAAAIGQAASSPMSNRVSDT